MADEQLGAEEEPPPRRSGVTAAVAAVAVVALLVATVGAVAWRGRSQPAPTTLPSSGPPGLLAEPPPERLPTASLAGFDGAAALDLAAFAGRPLLVNFWATWCAPCVAEMPDLQRLADAAGDDLTVLGVNTRDAPANASAFVDELDIRYALAADPEAGYFAAVNALGMPTTLFVDADGAIVQRHTGELTYDQLVELVDELLGVDVRG